MTVGRLEAAASAAASGKTEEQRRIELARAERRGWMAGQHASGYFAILSRRGIEVARFEKESDRDAVLALVKLEAAAGPAITALAFDVNYFADKEDAVAALQGACAHKGLVDALNRIDGRKP